MIPKLECALQAWTPAWARSTSSMAACCTRCCSKYSRIAASERKLSEYWPFLLAATLSFLAAVVWAGLRLWPIFRGRAPAGLRVEARVARWNRHLVPFLRRMMKDRSLVA